MSDFKFFGKGLIDVNNKILLDKAIEDGLKDQDKCILNNIANSMRNKYDWNKIASDLKKAIEHKFF